MRFPFKRCHDEIYRPGDIKSYVLGLIRDPEKDCEEKKKVLSALIYEFGWCRVVKDIIEEIGGKIPRKVRKRLFPVILSTIRDAILKIHPENIKDIFPVLERSFPQRRFLKQIFKIKEIDIVWLAENYWGKYKDYILKWFKRYGNVVESTHEFLYVVAKYSIPLEYVWKHVNYASLYFLLRHKDIRRLVFFIRKKGISFYPSDILQFYYFQKENAYIWGSLFTRDQLFDFVQWWRKNYQWNSWTRYEYKEVVKIIKVLLPYVKPAKRVSLP